MNISDKKKQNSSLKIFIILMVVLFVLLSSIFIYLRVSHGSLFGWRPFPSNDISNVNYKAPTSEQVTAGTTIKQSQVDSTSSSSKNSTSDASTDSTESNSSKTVVGFHITSADVLNGTLSVKTQIDTATSMGSCILTLSQTGSDSITQSVGVQALASISTCKGFSISTSGLSGNWTLTVLFSNDSMQGGASQSLNF